MTTTTKKTVTKTSKTQAQKYQNAVLREQKSSLSQAIKAWINAMKDNELQKQALEACELPKSVAYAVTQKTKDKSALIRECNEIISMVKGVDKETNETYTKAIDWKLIRKVHNSVLDKDKDIEAESKVREKNTIAVGSEFKLFGYCGYVAANEKGECIRVTQTEKYTATYIAILRTTYTVNLITKCVSEWIAKPVDMV